MLRPIQVINMHPMSLAYKAILHMTPLSTCLGIHQLVKVPYCKNTEELIYYES